MQINYNPDVLSCLANLSNDEVFTPPELVNQMLDFLPDDLWQNKEAKFLDPVTKSGVFLREIAKRLNNGLSAQIPDQQERVNHIFTQQLYGIAITELTSLLARRSVYCSKFANGQHSICSEFTTQQGNIRYNAINHTWQAGKCKFCGASQEVYDRETALESHAYEFIHTENPSNIFGKNMKFDVIIGNPPYQLSDGGHGTSAKPIYQNFIEQAKKLNPRFLSMIVPARWYAGGKGLNDFRDKMLADTRIRILVDYFDSTLCFPGVDISGGICYFLWDSNTKGDCSVTNVYRNKESKAVRPLFDKHIGTFIRFNEAISIIEKITQSTPNKFNTSISSRKPFGLSTKIENLRNDKFEGSIKLFAYPKDGYLDEKEILKSNDLIHKHKVLIAYAYGERGSFPYLVIGKPFIGEPNTACSETYLVIRAHQSKNYCKNVISYMTTRFFRFLVLLRKNTQHATKEVYSLVPELNFNESWTDEKLYAKYNLTQEEIDFIESMIRPMESVDE